MNTETIVGAAGKSPTAQMKPVAILSLTMIVISILGVTCLLAATPKNDGQLQTDANWSELIGSMEKMHVAMGAVKPSGDTDVDFVRLMIPHHQAAVDMAKAQLLYGDDPQIRRLAQEIVTDQQLEIELMQRWLQRQHAN